MRVDVAGQFLAVRSHLWARVSSGSISETLSPTRCPPNSSSVSALVTSLTKPAVAARPCALPLAENGNWVALTFVTGVLGLRLGQTERGDLRLAERGTRHEPVVTEVIVSAPAIVSAATTPCASATCASCSLAVTSPIA